MLKLKEFFAFPMFATALWLLWVFSLQTSADALIELLLVLLLISLLAWLMANTSKKIIRIENKINILLFSFTKSIKEI